ncbi:MAG TPA: cytochrome c oxidase subunit II [bacterium]|jgi:cytochrome c oxidase subunit 2|nr:cytochrome c oxidase subunit II [bacterium]
MKRFPAWSLFLACMFAPALALAVDLQGPSVWIPAAVSDRGRDIDNLYMHIMYIVIAIFVITQGLLLYSIIAFRAKPGRKATFTHGSTGVEVILAVVPAIILLYITVASVNLWKLVRLKQPDDHPVRIQVMAEQFSWNFRQAGPDAVFGTPDDVISAGEVAVPVDRNVVFYISSKDVIHSFFLPESRVKQDVVPGLLGRVWTKWNVIPVWDLASQKRVLLTLAEYEAAPVAVSGYKLNSEPNPVKKWYQFSDSARINYLRYHYDRDPEAKLLVLQNGKPVKVPPQYVLHYFEIACSQLCGNLHFAMRGTVRVLPPDQYEAWLKAQQPDDYLQSKWTGIWDKFHPEYDRAL